MMLNDSSFPTRSLPGVLEGLLEEAICGEDKANVPLEALDDDTDIEWSEEDIVFLHWRLLKEVGDLRDPERRLKKN